MSTPKIFESEYRFCLILWECEPMRITDLAKIAKERLDWSRTTSYTVVKRLTDRGVLKNDHSVITSIVSKQEAQVSEMEELVEKTFEGSFPAFIAAFAKSRKLTKTEEEEIRAIIERGGK